MELGNVAVLIVPCPQDAFKCFPDISKPKSLQRRASKDWSLQSKQRWLAGVALSTLGSCPSRPWCCFAIKVCAWWKRSSIWISLSSIPARWAGLLRAMFLVRMYKRNAQTKSYKYTHHQHEIKYVWLMYITFMELFSNLDFETQRRSWMAPSQAASLAGDLPWQVHWTVWESCSLRKIPWPRAPACCNVGRQRVELEAALRKDMSGRRGLVEMTVDSSVQKNRDLRIARSSQWLGSRANVINSNSHLGLTEEVPTTWITDGVMYGTKGSARYVLKGWLAPPSHYKFNWILRRGKWLQDNREQLIRYLNINTKERIPSNFGVGNEYCMPGYTVILYLPGFIMFGCLIWTSAFTSKDVLTLASDRCPFLDANGQDQYQYSGMSAISAPVYDLSSWVRWWTCPRFWDFQLSNHGGCITACILCSTKLEYLT